MGVRKREGVPGDAEVTEWGTVYFLVFASSRILWTQSLSRNTCVALFDLRRMTLEKCYD